LKEFTDDEKPVLLMKDVNDSVICMGVVWEKYFM